MMSTCLLLDKLPLELREAIYIETLRADDTIIIRTSGDGIQSECRDEPYVLPGLLSTCRQIRSEARKLFFETNTFQAVMSELPAETMLTAVRWLSSLPSNDRKSLKHIFVSFPYAGFEGSMKSWSNTLDEMVASGQDPMTAFSHLPCHLYHQRRVVLEDALRRLQAVENVTHSIINFEIEEFDGDMFPHIWKQVWQDCLDETEGVFGKMTVKKAKAQNTRPPGCTCHLME